MVTWAEVEEQARRGSLTTRLIADLTALPRSRLDGWHRNGIVRARTWRNPRKLPRIYAWSEYARARAAQEFLGRGVPPRALRCTLDRLDQTIRAWHELLRYDHRHALIERCGSEEGGFRYEVVKPDGADARAVAEPSAVYAGEEEALLLDVAEHLRDEGPLGRLRRFEPWVDLRPEVQGGSPTLRGSRIRTAYLAEAADAGNTAREIAEDLWIDPTATGKAIEFQRELDRRRSRAG